MLYGALFKTLDLISKLENIVSDMETKSEELENLLIENDQLNEEARQKNLEKFEKLTKMELYQFQKRFVELFDNSADLTFNSKLSYLQYNMLLEQKGWF